MLSAGQGWSSRRRPAPPPLAGGVPPLAAPGHHLRPGLLVEAEGLDRLLLRARQVLPASPEDLRLPLEPLGRAAHAERLHGLCLRLGELGPGPLPGRERQLVHLLRVALALGAPLRGVPSPDLALEVLERDARAAGVHRPGDPGEGAPGLQARRVLPPRGGLVPALLHDDAVPQLGLKHDVEAELRGRRPPDSLRGDCLGGGRLEGLDVLRHPDDQVVLACAPVLVLRGRLLKGVRGEERADHLLPAVLLDGPHLQAADLVHAEARPVLGALVERGHGGHQHLLEALHLAHVVGARMQQAGLAGLLGLLALGDLERLRPRRGEERTGLLHGEGVAEE
mmetsp:Transcript_31037/g.84154  ORF Transcript_31037/g.84154 Transcript_31037/m.84154 type:complete len:337 (-) Transcript_31037:850-1860(-)